MNKRRNAMIRVEIMIVLYYSGPMNSRNLIARIAVRYGVPKQVVCGNLSFMKRQNQVHFTPKPSFVYI